VSFVERVKLYSALLEKVLAVRRDVLKSVAGLYLNLEKTRKA
jgi:hypothetical protein